MLKENWIARTLVSFFITFMGLGGWAMQYNPGRGDYIIMFFLWFIIAYFISGFKHLTFLSIRKHVPALTRPARPIR